MYSRIYKIDYNFVKLYMHRIVCDVFSSGVFRIQYAFSKCSLFNQDANTKVVNRLGYHPLRTLQLIVRHRVSIIVFYITVRQNGALPIGSREHLHVIPMSFQYELSSLSSFFHNHTVRTKILPQRLFCFNWKWSRLR